MTATDELRKMLDERGVKWWEGWYKGSTLYDGANGIRYVADTALGELFIRNVLPITPEQAVEATLGRGTCREAKIERYWRGCGECGYIWEYMYGIGKCESPRFCPNCGRRVVTGDA